MFDLESIGKSLAWFERSKEKGHRDRASLYRQRPEFKSWVEKNDAAAAEIRALAKQYSAGVSRIEALHLGDPNLSDYLREYNTAVSAASAYQQKKIEMLALQDVVFTDGTLGSFPEASRKLDSYELYPHNLPAHVGAMKRAVAGMASRLNDLRTWYERQGARALAQGFREAFPEPKQNVADLVDTQIKHF